MGTTGLLRRRVIEYRRPWLYPEQEAAVFSPARWAVIEASTKTGKTTGCLIWLVEGACLGGGPGTEHWWVAPVYRQAEIAYERFKLYAPRELYRPNDSKRSSRLPNGATLRFLSGEKPDTLYGDDVRHAVLDEASRMREAAWHAVRSTLTATKGPARIIGNVKGRRNWFYSLARRAQAGEPDMHYAKLVVYHAVRAGLIAPEEVEDAQRTLPPAVFAELYLAEPQDDAGNPFGLEALQRCQQLDLAPGPPVGFGVDLAKAADWTVIVGLDAAGRPCHYERWQRPWAETLAAVRQVALRHPDAIVLVDSTGVGDPVVEFLQRHLEMPGLNPEARVDAAQRVQRAELEQRRRETETAAAWSGCPNVRGFRFTGTSKQQLLEMYALDIQRGEIGLLGTGREGEVVAAEHEAFAYEYTRTGVRYSAPEGMHDDTVMAYALAAQARRQAAAYTFGEPVLATF